jgi:hypothetical protein
MLGVIGAIAVCLALAFQSSNRVLFAQKEIQLREYRISHRHAIKEVVRDVLASDRLSEAESAAVQNLSHGNIPVRVYSAPFADANNQFVGFSNTRLLLLVAGQSLSENDGPTRNWGMLQRRYVVASKNAADANENDGLHHTLILLSERLINTLPEEIAELQAADAPSDDQPEAN